MPPSKRVEVEVEGRTLSLSNLDKVFYPETGFAKGQVIEYYTRYRRSCCRTCAAAT